MKKQIKIVKDARGKMLASYDATSNPFAMVQVAAEEVKEMKHTIEKAEMALDYEYDLPKLYKKVDPRSK